MVVLVVDLWQMPMWDENVDILYLCATPFLSIERLTTKQKPAEITLKVLPKKQQQHSDLCIRFYCLIFVCLMMHYSRDQCRHQNLSD